MKNGKTVLVIDDAAMMRNLLKHILVTKGYCICGEAADGEEGVEKFRQLKPDLVICDINMPGIDGIECLRRMLQINSAAKVIMCTSMGKKCFGAEAIAIGAKGYIVKPVAAADMVRVVERVMSETDYKSLVMERATGLGFTQKEILDFFGVFRSIAGVDLGDSVVTKDFLTANKDRIIIGLEALLSAKMPFDKMTGLVSMFSELV